MARTKSKKQVPESNQKTIEYKGYKIVKDSERMFIDTGKRKIRVRNRREAIEVIEELCNKVTTEKPEWPRGGYTIHPPEDCDRRMQFQKDGNFWVENVICIFYCKKESCIVHKRIMAGRAERIRKLKDGSSLIVAYEIKYKAKKRIVEKGTIKVKDIEGGDKPEDVQKINDAINQKYEKFPVKRILNFSVQKGAFDENDESNSQDVTRNRLEAKTEG